MNATTSIASSRFLGYLGLLAGLGLLGTSLGAAGSPQEEGGLRRIDPPSSDAPEAPVSQPGADDVSVWADRLRDPDLDRREEHLDALFERGGEARAILEELERSEEKELAWTARLALRGLGRGADRPFGAFSGHGLDDRSLEELLERRFGLELPWSREPLGLDFLDGSVFQLRRPQATSESRSVRIQQDEEGWVIRIVETVDGEESVKEYRGESLEEILSANPELEEQLAARGVSAAGPSGGVHFRFEPRGLLGLGDLPFFGHDHLRGRLHERRHDRDGGRFFFSRRGPSQPVRTDKLGVRVGPVPLELGRELDLEPGVGLRVDSTFPGTIAHLLGVGSGDVLTELNDTPLRSAEDVTSAMAAASESETGEVRLEWIDSLGECHERTWRPDEDPEDGRHERRRRHEQREF